MAGPVSNSRLLRGGAGSGRAGAHNWGLTRVWERYPGRMHCCQRRPATCHPRTWTATLVGLSKGGSQGFRKEANESWVAAGKSQKCPEQVPFGTPPETGRFKLGRVFACAEKADAKFHARTLVKKHIGAGSSASQPSSTSGPDRASAIVSLGGGAVTTSYHQDQGHERPSDPQLIEIPQGSTCEHDFRRTSICATSHSLRPRFACAHQRTPPHLG